MLSPSFQMADDLLSKVAIDKSNHDKNDESTFRMQKMQEQIQQLFLKMRLARQGRQDCVDLPNMLATIENKLIDQTVCTAAAQFGATIPHDQQQLLQRPPLKWKFPIFDGSDPLR